MGLFTNQFSNVIEWEEFRDDLLFWKWNNKEIKKGSRLIIRPGQDAIFMYNGKLEGVFTEEGSYDVESEIIPFLSTLKGFKFGFNSGIRAEVLFINTKEFTVRWGTRQAINIPNQYLPGGLPVRANGTFNCKLSDHMAFIDKIAGIKHQYSIEETKERVLSFLDQLLMKWIVKEGKDMFNLQANSFDISKGICEDLDYEMSKIGISITSFNIGSFSYPEEVQKMINKVASHSMVGDLNKYQQISVLDGMKSGQSNGGSVASDMVSMQMGMVMGQQMINNMQQNNNNKNVQESSNGDYPKFCPNCGTKTTGGKFCGECGQKL